MIKSLSDIIGNSEWSNQEVTVRCKIESGPKTGTRGGQKTLYDLDTSGFNYRGEAYLSLWHESPEWFGPITKTEDHVRELLEEVPLQSNETVLVRGIPNRYQDKWYLNVSSVLIRQPELTIGKSEMRKASECPRIYDLLYEKQIYNPNQFSSSGGSLKGVVAHTVLEKVIDDSLYRSFFNTQSWSTSDIKSCVKDVIENEFSLEMAISRLAWVSTNQIKENAVSALEPLFTNEHFCKLIAEANELEVERTLATSTGFNGRVDLLIDGIPYDLKTTYEFDQQTLRKHKFQLRLYLLALLIETLQPGESMRDYLDEFPSGVIVYPNLKHSNEVRFEEVELRKKDIAELLELRNEAAVLRDAFSVPTTYERDCNGCTFKEETTVGAGENGEMLPSPCKFHCQSERRWSCFEVKDGDVITQCPLFEECDQRLEFRDPRVTDHYTTLRNALNAELEARVEAGEKLDQLDAESLSQAGLLLTGLQAQVRRGESRIVYEANGNVVPGFDIGETVRISPDGSDLYRRATYCGQSGSELVFQFNGKPDHRFGRADETYTVTQTLEATTYSRNLLAQLDYAQRSGVSPLIENTQRAHEAEQRLDPDEPSKIASFLDNKELYIDLPARRDRNQLLSELVESIVTTEFAAPSGEPISEDDQRVLVLTEHPHQADRLGQVLADTESAVRLDGLGKGTLETITPGQDSHEIYRSILEANTIVSTMDYALSEQWFHRMESGDEDNRSHSDRFFDAVVLVGATTLAEPQFHFLQILGDRLIAIGDVLQNGPEMISQEAREEGLGESYFVRSYRRFSRLESSSAQCVSFPGEIVSHAADIFQETDRNINGIDGTIQFEHVDAFSEATTNETTVTHTIESQTDDPRYLRLRPKESVDALYINQQLNSLRTLDADTLRVGQTYTIGDVRFEVLTNAPNDSSAHEVEINIGIENTPYLSRRLLKNVDEAERIAELAARESPDRIVTPFVAQAQEIRYQIQQYDLDIPVQLPRELDGTIEDSAIVSLTTANDEHIPASNIANVETAYELLTSGRELLIVGHEPTISRNSIFKRLIDATDTEA